MGQSRQEVAHIPTLEVPWPVEAHVQFLVHTEALEVLACDGLGGAENAFDSKQ